jgi:type I restriction enzyme M protein
MLDTETKRRIDEARDILVGKLPDPKSQVEQITIALIYKFMYDMDKEALDFGGNATFFTGEWEKYNWINIFDPKIGGHEMLNLYGEAIVKLNQNPNIPQLFRDIFKNAYLPYRDPETLKLFLKTINGFTYDHSERLGDAFEYLLSVLGSQGDAGQFRTPRHIIDFIVAVLQPKKNETIGDPACGTAGFLISSYKYIVEQNTKKNKGDLLTPDDKKKMMQRFTGYDISPDMVRLSLVNMYLHNFTTPKIYEYDTLTSEERWNESFDIIMANPPFMSPKGGIKPHKKFSIQANRSEVLFVDYIMEHINPATGRAGVIVPEEIIFKRDKAYKQLRQLLVDKKSLYAVVSLPAGIFQPYTPVKTSILLMDRALAKKTDNILFVKIENDGFDLGTQRRVIDKNDLTEGLVQLQEYKESILNNSDFMSNNKNVFVVDKKLIKGIGDYNLSVGRYQINDHVKQTNFEMVRLENVLDYEQPTKYIVESENYSDNYNTPVLTAGKTFILGYTNEVNGIFSEDLPVIIFDDFTTATKFVDFQFKVKSSAMKILKAKKEIADIKFLYYVMQKIEFNSSDHKRYWISQYSQIEIPLPPLSVQHEIVNKIESYKAIIDGAKQVVQNYKPQIDIDPDWEMVELGDYANFSTGGTPSKANPLFWIGDIPWISPKDMKVDFIGNAEDHITLGAIESSSAKMVSPNTILIVVRSGILQHTMPIAITTKPVSFNQDIISIEPESTILLSAYLFYYLKSTSSKHLEIGIKKGVTVESFQNGYFKSLQIPLPSISIQQQTVNRIDQEQQLVNANKELIKIYEQKIKDEINKLWKPAVKEYEVEEEKVGVAAEG